MNDLKGEHFQRPGWLCRLHYFIPNLRLDSTGRPCIQLSMSKQRISEREEVTLQSSQVDWESPADHCCNCLWDHMARFFYALIIPRGSYFGLNKELTMVLKMKSFLVDKFENRPIFELQLLSVLQAICLWQPSLSILEFHYFLPSSQIHQFYHKYSNHFKHVFKTDCSKNYES